MNIKKIGLGLLASSSLLLAACSNDAEEANADTLVEDREIEMTYVAWDEVISSTNVLGTVFEDLGYDVTLTNVDNPVMWQSVATGDADAMLAATLPDTHAPQYEEYGDQVTHAGTSLEGIENALTVPAYMDDVDSITDLTDEADQSITGIEAGAGIMEMTQDALETYPNLEDWDLVSSSTGAMVTELESAIEDEEEIVITGWEPHWIYQQHDLKMLEDPEGVLGGGDTHNTMVREDLQEEDPIAFSVLSNFEWELDDVYEVMIDLSEGVDPDEAARNWVDENQGKVDEWTAEAREMAAEQSEESSEE